MKRFPPVGITLPWKVADGPPVTKRLIFTGPRGGHVWRTSLNEEVWKRALASAGLISGRKPGGSYVESRENGMHALRHFYASVLLDAGEPGTHSEGNRSRLRHVPLNLVEGRDRRALKESSLALSPLSGRGLACEQENLSCSQARTTGDEVPIDGRETLSRVATCIERDKTCCSTCGTICSTLGTPTHQGTPLLLPFYCESRKGSI